MYLAIFNKIIIFITIIIFSLMVKFWLQIIIWSATQIISYLVIYGTLKIPVPCQVKGPLPWSSLSSLASQGPLQIPLLFYVRIWNASRYNIQLEQNTKELISYWDLDKDFSIFWHGNFHVKKAELSNKTNWWDWLHQIVCHTKFKVSTKYVSPS